MAYLDLNSIQVTNPGSILTAAWCDQARDNDAFLYDRPNCSVYNNTTQSLTDDTSTALTANSENHDNDAMHSTTVNTARITAQTAGRYLFNGTVEFTANSTGRRLVYLRKNGGTANLLYSAAAPTSPTTAVGSFTKTYVMVAGDYIEVLANQNSGGALTVTLAEFVGINMTG